MPTPVPAGLKLGVIEPVDAIRNFQARSLLLPSFRWQDVWQEEHQRGFAVAGVMREDVLSVFRDALDAKFQTGGTLADFKSEIKPLLAKKGFWGDVEITDPTTKEVRITRFDDARLQLIYDVNVRQSYAAGKWQRYQQTKAQLPFVQYKTMEDAHVRPAHAAWDNVVLPIDDAWWQTHWPPNGWRCRCYAVQLSQRSVDRLETGGQKLIRTAPPDAAVPYVNPYTGEIKQVPSGVDPGFGYNPGVDNSGRDASLAETVLQKAMRSDAYSGAVVAAQAATDMPALLVRRADQFAKWVDDVRNAARPSGNVFALGVVRPEIVRAVAAAGVPLDSAMIAVRDDDLFHALRSVDNRVAVPLALYKQLPALLYRPVAVVQALDDLRNIIYLVDGVGADGQVVKLFIRIDQDVKQVVDGQRVRKVMNLVRTASLQTPEALHDPNNFKVLWGTWK